MIMFNTISIPITVLQRCTYRSRFYIVWTVCFTGVILLCVYTIGFSVESDSLPMIAPLYPFYYSDAEEAGTYDETPGDYVERWMGYRHINVSRLFYNRVPKCGSETVRFILLRLAWFNDFGWTTSNIYLNYTMSVQEQHSFITEKFMNINPPFIFERHLHHIDFRRFGMEQPLYTNVVRDPIERLVSWYYFVRFQEGHVRNMSEWRRNMSYDQCVQENHPECTAEYNYFRIIPFFCGQSYECRFQSDVSLAMAKRHFDEDYIAVGLAEDLRNYFVIMEYLLPQFFKGATEMYDLLADDLVERSKTQKKRAITPKTRNLMRLRLKHEYEFFYFAKQRFYRLLYLIEAAMKNKESNS